MENTKIKKQCVVIPNARKNTVRDLQVTILQKME